MKKNIDNNSDAYNDIDQFNERDDQSNERDENDSGFKDNGREFHCDDTIYNILYNESDFLQKKEEAVDDKRCRSYGHLWTRCTKEDCYGLNYKQCLKERRNICEFCGYHLKMSSSDRIEFLIDPGTWHPMDEDMVSVDPISWTGEDEIKYVDPRTGKYYVNPENGEYIDPFTWNPKPKDEDEEDMGSSDPLTWNPKPKDEDEEDMGSEYPITWNPRSRTWNPRPLTCNFMDQDKYMALTWNLTEEEEDMGYADPLTWNPRDEDEDEDEEDMAPIPFHLKEEPYQTRLDSYQETTGLKDAVQTGTGRLNGIPLAIAIMEFEFIGGSMGSVVGEKITRLVEYATNHNLPLIIVCASGGARMQEGSLSLMQMAKISSALHFYQIKKKLLYVSILTSPTTGGVTASFGMLGDVILAEPEAYIAFAGKRVIEELLKVEVPEGSQSAEVLFEKGLVDFIAPRSYMKELLSLVFQVHGFRPLT